MPTTYPNVNIAGGGNSNSSTSSLNLAFLDQRYLDVASADKMLVNLDMNTHNIINVTDPINTQDAATKNYVDNNTGRQLIGLFPVLTSNTDSGWTASASSEFSTAFAAYKVTANSDWATLGSTTNFWVQIKIPTTMTAQEPFRISVKGRLGTANEQMSSWKFDASNDGTTYTTLLTQSNTIVNTATTLYNVDAGGVSYKYFRMFALTASSGSVNPGLSQFQIYVMTDKKYLRLDGTNSMTSNLNMNSNKINNLTDPTSAQDAVTKNYVDTADNLRLKTDGTNSMTGILLMGNNRIWNVMDPTSNQDAATKNYVDTSVATKKKSSVGLFPQLWSTNTPVNGWKAYASSEISSSFLAYNVTLTNGEWATNGVTANFYVTITMPSSLQGVEPYGFSVKGKTSSNEQITNWRFQVATAAGGTVTFLYSS